MMGLVFAVVLVLVALAIIYLAGPKLNIPQDMLNIVAVVVVLVFVLAVLAWGMGGGVNWPAWGR